MIYAKIMHHIERQIEAGTLKPGSKLPSIRSLSETFGCSNNTVIKAYSELEKKHLIYTVPKSGFYIVENMYPRNADAAINPVVDFLSAGPDKSIMPFRDYQHCINQAIEIYKEDMFTYSDKQGLYSLRSELARHLQDLQVFTVPERICIVSGSQQALHLFVSLPFPNGKHDICVEQPTHRSLIESIKLQGTKTFGVGITHEGIDLNHLESLFKRNTIKFFYTVSRFHNPTGFSYSNAQKRKIVELAQKYDVYIIEDDYMGDLDTNLKQDPMFAYDPSGRVIYTKSFSKVMLPGLRLGLAVVPDSMKDQFLRTKFASDLHTPVLTQGALEIYLKSGMYAAHILRMREIYSRKAELLQEAYRAHLPAEVTYSGSMSGFYSTISLPGRLKAKNLVDHLRKQQVLVDDVRGMFLPEFERDTMIRLSVSQVDEALIHTGIRLIASEITKLQLNKWDVKFV
ncbi:PLP-dependent aminotransferase family protein [Paenibacillus chartarius]|uniref:PLP-dependent aminotransferase family protein n=1 Tax=Paenibacillus chartarius TaxID=747481 RepID=A0ABV6DUG2_9BACL